MKVFLTVHAKAETPIDVFREIAGPLVGHAHGWAGLSVVDSATDADSIIMLTPQKVLSKMFPKFAQKRLSVCNMDTREVWLNEDRWRRTQPDESHLSLPAYRAYMVHHELGHALGHGHSDGKCEGERQLVPVMVQQTLGIGGCTPNPFPTPGELANQTTPN